MKLELYNKGQQWLQERRDGVSMREIAARDGVFIHTIYLVCAEVATLMKQNGERIPMKPTPIELRPKWSIPDTRLLSEARAGAEEITVNLAHGHKVKYKKE